MTETTQPDPQVVAWMRRYLTRHPAASQYAAVLAAQDAFSHSALRSNITSVVLADAYEAARKPLTRKPLTAADIPAGRGPTSLYVDERGGLRIRNADGSTEPVPYGAGLSQALRAAIGEHLAATLPTVTAEEDAP